MSSVVQIHDIIKDRLYTYLKLCLSKQPELGGEVSPATVVARDGSYCRYSCYT